MKAAGKTHGVSVGFGLIMALLLAISGLGAFYLHTLNQAVRDIVEVHNEKFRLAAEMVITARERALQLQSILHEPDPFLRDERTPRFHELAGRFRGARQTLLKLPLSPLERAILQQQNQHTSKGSQLQDMVLDLAQSERMDEANRLLLSDAIPAQDRATTELQRFLDHQVENGRRAAAASSEQVRTATALSVGGGLIALILAGTIAVVVSRRQGRLMADLAAANQELQYQKIALDEHAIVSIADPGGRITYVNDKFSAISQYPREELIGQNHRIVKSNLHPPEFYIDMWKTIGAGRVWRGEICNRSKDGNPYWVASTIVPFLDAAGKPYQYVAVRTDITARKRLEATLRVANRELQTRVEERTRALSDAMKQLEADIAARKQAQEQLHRQNQELHELNHKLQDAQGQLLQSEKMASIGQLAAGVAHEINNPIGFVNSNLGTLHSYVADLLAALDAYAGLTPDSAELDALRRRLDLDFLKEDIPALLKESRDGIDRVRKIVQDLKDFSRLDSSPEWQFSDLRQGLESTLNIAHNEIKYRAQVATAFADLPPVECLPSQLNQVFLNLLVNAAQAMPEGADGRITVRTAQLDAEHVVVTVADNGKGIPAEIIQRIFDPFFTTKPVGQGTGLGLSLAYGIVQKHHGRFEVESEPGRGSTFRIVLPVRQPKAEALTPSPYPRTSLEGSSTLPSPAGGRGAGDEGRGELREAAGRPAA